MKFNKYLMMAFAVFASLALFACGDDTPTGGLDDINGGDDNGNGEEVESVYYGLTVDVDGDTFTFVVDMTDLEDFDPEEYSVFAAGEFGEIEWAEPGTAEELELTHMEDAEDFPASSGVEVPAGEMEYKFFSDFIAEGWDGGEWEAGANRVVDVVAGESNMDEWGDEPEE